MAKEIHAFYEKPEHAPLEHTTAFVQNIQEAIVHSGGNADMVIRMEVAALAVLTQSITRPDAPLSYRFPKTCPNPHASYLVSLWLVSQHTHIPDPSHPMWTKLGSYTDHYGRVVNGWQEGGYLYNLWIHMSPNVHSFPRLLANPHFRTYDAFIGYLKQGDSANDAWRTAHHYLYVDPTAHAEAAAADAPAEPEDTPLSYVDERDKARQDAREAARKARKKNASPPPYVDERDRARQEARKAKKAHEEEARRKEEEGEKSQREKPDTSHRQDSRQGATGAGANSGGQDNGHGGHERPHAHRQDSHGASGSGTRPAAGAHAAEAPEDKIEKYLSGYDEKAAQFDSRKWQPGELTFEAFPWLVLKKQKSVKRTDVTEAKVYAFMDKKKQHMSRTDYVKFLRSALLRYHPDKLKQRQAFIPAGEYMILEEACKISTTALNALFSSRS